MCGASGASCFHGECRAVGGSERCECDDMYAGSQCFFRGQLLYFELPLAAAAMLVALAVGVGMTRKVRAMLTFSDATVDAFAFPREWKRGEEAVDELEMIVHEEDPAPTSRCSSACLRRWIGVWVGPTSKSLPFKPRRQVLENMLISLTLLFEVLPWIQSTTLAFLPVVPWPQTAKSAAELLRLSLLYPMWSHLNPAHFPIIAFYCALGFVPGMLLLACMIGMKRFPMFKPQPTNAPSEDLCTILLRLYSEWLVLPALIMLLLPLECFLIGYFSQPTDSTPLPSIDSKCFAIIPIVYAVGGTLVMFVYWMVACAISFQLNCESSHPLPIIWTDVRYARVCCLFRVPLVIGVISFMNANGIALCACCTIHGIIHVFANTWMRPSSLTLVNGVRTYGAIMSTWSGSIGLVTSMLDDPSVKVTFEIWSLGAIAITALACSLLFLLYSDQCWSIRLGPKTGSSLAAVVSIAPPKDGTELEKSRQDDPMPKPRLMPRLGLARARRRTTTTGITADS